MLEVSKNFRSVFQIPLLKGRNLKTQIWSKGKEDGL